MLTKAVSAGGRHLIVLEGFMGFWDTLLVQLMDACVWLEIPYEVAIDRRMRTTPMPKQHYNGALWPNYERYRELVFGESFSALTAGRLCEIDACSGAVGERLRAAAMGRLSMLAFQPRKVLEGLEADLEAEAPAAAAAPKRAGAKPAARPKKKKKKAPTTAQPS